MKEENIDGRTKEFKKKYKIKGKKKSYSMRCLWRGCEEQAILGYIYCKKHSKIIV